MPQGSPTGSSLATVSEVPGTELRQLQATFENFREFVARYSPWLSDTCIFVETLEAVPVGAPVRLEIWLRDRPQLIKALGQVDWVRAASDDGEDGPPGVAVNITFLDPASTRLIDSIFRLYTGQQSAAMGKDVVETWELDVESLIDQAFPGAPIPGAAPSEAAPTDVASADATPEDATPEDATPEDATPEDATPEDATPPTPSHEDALDWTLPEGVVVATPAETAPPDAAPSHDDSLDWTLPEGVVVAEPGPSEVPGEQSVPIELEVPAVNVPEAPREPATPMPGASVEPPAWADSDVATLSPPPSAVSSLEGPAIVTPTLGGHDDSPRATKPMAALEPTAPEEDAEWEARFSSAFSEHDATEKNEILPAEQNVVPPRQVAFQETPVDEVSDFGFGLVDTSTPEAGGTAEQALPPLEDDTATFGTAAERLAPAQQTVPAQHIAPAQDVAPAPEALSPIASAELDNGVPSANFTPPLAGAASTSDDSDATFLQRSVLVFLLAVVAVGLLFFWFRGRPTAPKPVTTIADTSGSETASVAPSTPPEATTPSEPVVSEPSAAEPSATEPASAEPSTTTPSVTPPAEPPTVDVTDTPLVEPDTSTETAVSPPPAAPPAAAPSEPAPPVAPTIAAQDPAAITADVETVVKGWATAWSEQNPQAYIASYAPDFNPPGTSRQEWERQRVARIQAPTNIRVQAKDISVTVLDASRAQASFYQDYETDTKHLFTWKTMELARLPEGWRIVKERVGR